MSSIDLLALIIFFICIILYSTLIVYGLRNPEATRRGSLNLIFERWVETRLRQGESAIVPIQANRNQIMANSIFISSLLVLLGILLGLFPLISTERDLIPGISLSVIQITLIFLITIFSLFNFVLSIRLLVRFTLLIGSEPQDCNICGMGGLTFTKKTLISAQNRWLFGLRGLFFLIPSLSWLIDAGFFIVGTIAVTAYLIFFEDIIEDILQNHKHDLC